MSYTKEQLKESVRLKNELQVEGFNFDVSLFDGLGIGEKYLETVNLLFTMDKHVHQGVRFPYMFYLPVGGFRVHPTWNQKSPYRIVKEDGVFHVKKGHEIIVEDIQFVRRPAYYDLKTASGADMRTVAEEFGYGSLFVVYSNECCLKDKGQDCLFCNINSTKNWYGEEMNIQWKSAKDIAETIKHCYADGSHSHFTISGGFVPERREVEYYVDIAEEIKDALQTDDFNGTACVGAPADLSVVEHYKDAGYSSIATNIEIWNPHMFEVICPGKSAMCGGRENWIKTLEHELDVFGKFKVRSTLVSGIEPKESLLEGIEYLVSKGICALPSQWCVNVGSPLQGARTPDPDWHWEVFERTNAIYKKYGLDYHTLRDATAEPDTVAHDLLRVEDGVELFDNLDALR